MIVWKNGWQMGTSKYSKGKGGRFPGRGGRGRRKQQPWEARAAHAVEDPSTLAEHVIALTYRGDWMKNPSERIYLLDQEFARHDIAYAAELISARWHPSSFIIYVADTMRVKAEQIITQLEYRNQPAEKPARIGEVHAPKRATEIRVIKPADVPAHLKNHTWEFAVYTVWTGPSWISDRLYVALLFRNTARTVYGMREWHGPGAPYAHDKMARRIVTDEDFRRSLMTDDPRVAEMWDELDA